MTGRAEGRPPIEVRRAGATRRLYVGGVLASQWNPGRALAGGYWDALATAPLLVPHPCRTALVLGLGGGAVVHVLRRTVGPSRIVGVESDERVLRAAALDFPLRGPDLRVLVQDAAEALRATPSTTLRVTQERFDLVIDDVYEMARMRARRPATEGLRWFRAVVRRTAAAGVLAVNFVDEAAFARARPTLSRALAGFRTVVRFDFDAWQNVVVAAARGAGSVARYESALSGAVPGREVRARGFRLTDVRMRRRPRARPGAGGPPPGRRGR